MSNTENDQHGDGETPTTGQTVSSDSGAAEAVMSVRHSAAPALTEEEHQRLGAVEDYLMGDSQ